MSTAFPDLKPFPGQTNNPRAVIGGNRPPLEEQVIADFMEGLKTHPDRILERVAQMVGRAEGARPCLGDDELAGRYGDFIKMGGAVAKAIDAEREKHNRPLLTAQRALKSRADGLTDQLNRAVAKVRSFLNAYVADEKRKADEKRRAAEAEAQRLREEQEAAARAAAQARAAGAGPDAAPEPEPEPLVEIAAVKVEAPVARGDLGARVGTRTIWRHEIESVRQVPDRYLKHAKVVEALNSVIGQAIRSGEREIKGVRIWEETAASVR